jgi:UDP-N-acetylglucosamine:LPS N-acetylglucosamine transferase
MKSPDGPKILIVSSDTGGGHRSAAAAIVAGVQEHFEGEPCTVRVVRAVEESNRVSARLVDLYNWMLCNKQHWMKYLYWAVNRFRPETSAFFNRRCTGYVRDVVEHWGPQIVVSVHPMVQHTFARVLKELHLADRVPLVSVVTDPGYGFWKGWACDDVKLYLVASEEARRQLTDYGVAPERIKILGMPVHPKFIAAKPGAAQAARRAMGLDPEKFTVFLNAGRAGGGNVLAVFRELVRGQLNVQAIFLAGKNRAVRAAAQSLAVRAAFQTKVVGYTAHIERMMSAASVMISKLGGLTTFESLACRVPIVADAITPPMPQEAGTVTLILKHGAGIVLRKAADIVPEIRRMVEDKAHYAAMRSATTGLAIPDATRRIVEEITALLGRRPVSGYVSVPPQSRDVVAGNPYLQEDDQPLEAPEPALRD